MSATTAIEGIRAPLAPRPTLLARLSALARSGHLDRELAAGADPEASPALALRARSLLSQRSRAGIAESLDRAIRSASEPYRRSSQAPLSSPAILEARPELEALSAELRDDTDHRAQGVALARLLLVEPTSPLYHRGAAEDGCADDLLAALRLAYRALCVGGTH